MLRRARSPLGSRREVVVHDARVEDGLERRVRWTLACLAGVAGLAALGTLLLPATLARWSGAPSLAALQPWMALAAAVATLSAALAATIASAPRRYAHLLLLLALGLGAASFSLQSGEGVVALLASAAALVLAALLLAAYLAFWLAESPSAATLERDRTILRAVLETLVPAGGRVAIGAADPRVERAILQSYRRSGRWGSVRLRVALRIVEGASLRIAGARFEQADAGLRDLVLERLLTASRALVRQPIEELRAVALDRFYSDPRVRAAIGFDDQHVRTRLQEGPNAIAHAATLAAASALEADAEAADGAMAAEPSESPEPTGPTVLSERLQTLRLVRAGPFRP